MRPTADPDRSFWSKTAEADSWMDDLAPTPIDADDTPTLEALTTGRHEPTERVFHELRDLTPSTPVRASTGGNDTPAEPDDALPPSAFSIDTVSDDLLPSWDLDLG